MRFFFQNIKLYLSKNKKKTNTANCDIYKNSPNHILLPTSGEFIKDGVPELPR